MTTSFYYSPCKDPSDVSSKSDIHVIQQYKLVTYHLQQVYSVDRDIHMLLQSHLLLMRIPYTPTIQRNLSKPKTFWVSPFFSTWLFCFETKPVKETKLGIKENIAVYR